MHISPAHAIADMDVHVAVLLRFPPSSNGSHDVGSFRPASSVRVRSQNEHGPTSQMDDRMRYGATWSPAVSLRKS